MADISSSRSGSPDLLTVLTSSQKLAAGLATAKRERDLLENAAKEFAQLFRADYAGMLMAHPDGSGQIDGEYPTNSKLSNLTLSPDVRLISEHCSRGLVTTVDSVSATNLLSQKARETILQAELQSMALLPLGQNGGRWIGSVMLGFKHDLTLSAGAFDTATALAQQVGGLVSTARQIERTQRQTEQFKALLSLTERMGHVETQEDLAYEVAQAIPALLPVTQFAILFGDLAAPSLSLYARWENGFAQRVRPEQPVSVDTAKTLLSLLASESDVLVADFAARQPPVQGILQVQTRSGMASTLDVGEAPIGALLIESDHLDAYSEADQTIFNQLAVQMNVALTRLNASFGLMRAASSSNAVNQVSEQMQGEASSIGVLNSAALATFRVLGARRVSIKLGNPFNTLNGVNGTEGT